MIMIVDGFTNYVLSFRISFPGILPSGQRPGVTEGHLPGQLHRLVYDCFWDTELHFNT